MGSAGEIDDRQRDRPGRRDDLERPAVNRREGGAQGFVAGHDHAKRSFEAGHVQHALQAERLADVIGRALRHQLVEKPHPLLGERSRLRAHLRSGHNHVGWGRAPGGAQ